MEAFLKIRLSALGSDPTAGMGRSYLKDRKRSFFVPIIDTRRARSIRLAWLPSRAADGMAVGVVRVIATAIGGIGRAASATTWRCRATRRRSKSSTSSARGWCARIRTGSAAGPASTSKSMKPGLAAPFLRHGHAEKAEPPPSPVAHSRGEPLLPAPTFQAAGYFPSSVNTGSQSAGAGLGSGFSARGRTARLMRLRLVFSGSGRAGSWHRRRNNGRPRRTMSGVSCCGLR